jgi:predicted RNA-binding Zn-ribbon protein involved in translation (DUF1610 family)
MAFSSGSTSVRNNKGKGRQYICPACFREFVRKAKAVPRTGKPICPDCGEESNLRSEVYK